MKILSIFFLFYCGMLFGQKAPDLNKYNTKKEKAAAWIDYCDNLLVLENNSELRNAARIGLKMTAASDLEHRSLFTFYIGVSFNYGIETDSARYYLEKSEEYARKINNGKRLLEALKQLHYVYSNYGETKKQNRILSAFAQIIDTIKDLDAKADIYSVMGDYYIGRSQYENGLSYKFKGLKLQKDALHRGNATDSTNFGVQLIVIAELYVGLKKYEFALEYLKESEMYVTNYRLAKAHIHKDRVEIYTNTNLPQDARKAYSDLLLLLKNETDIGCWGIVIESDLILANYYTKKGDLGKAEFYTTHANELAPSYADNFLQAQVDFSNGLISLKKKDFRKAINYFKSAEPITEEDDKELTAQLKQALAETYSALGNHKEAYRYQLEYSSLREELSREESKKNVAEMEARYQNERKQSKIDQLSSKNTINNLKIKEADRQYIYLLCAMLTVFAIALLIFRQSRKRKQLNAQLQLLNEELKIVSANKTRFFSILNHDLRSPVANLIHFLQIQSESPDLMDEATKKRLELRTMESAEHLLRSMEDMLLWSKGQMQQFKPEIALLNVREVFAELENYFASDDRVKVVVDKTTEIQLSTDFNYLLTILRNLTANAIKVLEKTEQPKITWSVLKYEGTTKLMITDNGPGASTTQFKALYDPKEVVGIKTGLGLHLIRDLAQAIHCKVEVNSEQNVGTTITLVFA
ncbi:MAG: ATP-binding protein [Bacteroidota bacterium]